MALTFEGGIGVVTVGLICVLPLSPSVTDKVKTITQICQGDSHHDTRKDTRVWRRDAPSESIALYLAE